MNPLRVGIVGCGNVLSAYWPQLERLKLRGEAEVVAACGRQSQRDLVAGQLGVGRFYTDHRQLVDAADVDLVLVLTSTPSHYAVSRSALEAGKHVVSEKPMAMTLDEAADLVATARRSRGLYVCAPFTLLSPTYQAMGRRIRRGEIGKVCSARGRYGWSGPWWTEWFYRPGGGPLLDLAVYNITSLTGWLGPVRRVMAMSGVAVPERMVNGRTMSVEVDDNVHVLLDFGESCFAAVTSGFVIQQYRSPALELYGTQGTLQMLGDDWDPDGYELWLNSAGCWQVFKESEPDWPWADGLRHAIHCIRRGELPIITPEHAYHVLEVMLAGQAAGRDGRAHAVASTFARIEFPEPAGAEPAHRVHDRTRHELPGSEAAAPHS